MSTLSLWNCFREEARNGFPPPLAIGLLLKTFSVAGAVVIDRETMGFGVEVKDQIFYWGGETG